jgi:hypothetical protein
MCDRYGITGLKVRFGKNRRGWGGMRRVIPFVSFPAQDNHYSGPEWAGCLRAGLILHELAHVIVALKYRRGGHGPEFIRTLDELLKASQGLF